MLRWFCFLTKSSEVLNFQMSLGETFGTRNKDTWVTFSPELMSEIRRVYAAYDATYDASKVGINPNPEGLRPGQSTSVSSDFEHYYILLDVGYACTIAALSISLLIIFKFRFS